MVQNRERKLVQQWIDRFHITSLKWRNVRVGKIPEGPNPELYSTLRKYADAIFFENDTVFIVEAKIIPKANVIFDLLDYKARFIDTPDFIQFKGKPIKLIYLSAVNDDYVREQCTNHGVKFVVFMPEWIKSYLREKGHRI